MRTELKNLREAETYLGIKYRKELWIPLSTEEPSFNTEDTFAKLYMMVVFQDKLQQLGYHVCADLDTISSCIQLLDIESMTKGMNSVLRILTQLTGNDIEHTYVFGTKQLILSDTGADREVANYLAYIVSYAFGAPVTVDLEAKIFNVIDTNNTNKVTNLISIDDVDQIVSQIVKEDIQSVLKRVEDAFDNVPEGCTVLNVYFTFFDIANVKLLGVYSNLVSGDIPLNDSQKEDLDIILEIFHRDIHSGGSIGKAAQQIIQDTVIPCKETLTYMIASNIEHNYPFISFLSKSITSATDILRVLDIYSGGDGVIRRRMEFKRLNYMAWGAFVTLLCMCPHRMEGFAQYPELWKCALNAIKPERHKLLTKEYQEVIRDMNRLRDGDFPPTVNSIVQKQIETVEKDPSRFQKCIDMMLKFPGHFVRNFDKFVRSAYKGITNHPTSDFTVQSFEFHIMPAFIKAIKEVQSTKMLIQLFSYYRCRITDKDKARIFKTKGSKYLQALQPVQDPLTSPEREDLFMSEICQALYMEITDRFRNLPYMGKVYIDESITGYTAPLDIRNANDSDMNFIPRGSVFKYNSDGNSVFKLIPYIHWTNMENGNRVDIDLSALFVNENMKSMGRVSYTNHVLAKNGISIGIHSGDFVDGGEYGGKGVSESILIDPITASEASVRYIIIQLHDFTQYGFANNNTVFGLNIRDKNTAKKELYKPNMPNTSAMLANFALEESLKLFISNISTKGASMVIPAIIDIKNELIYWVDLDAGNMNAPFINNVESTAPVTVNQIQAFFNMRFVMCTDIIGMHIASRGIMVDNPELADTIFCDDNSDVARIYSDPVYANTKRIITPSMTDIWVGEMIQPKTSK